MKKGIIIFVSIVLIYILSVTLLILLYPKEVTLKTKPEIVNINLKGEVIFPGTYKVRKGTTLAKLIQFSNGFTPFADNSINLNQALDKDQTINIPRISNLENINKFDLNKITFKELVKLDYITEKRAENIILYRKTNKSFKNIEELINVEGVGVKTFEKIKDYFFIAE